MSTGALIRRWYLVIVGGAGALIHFGTAALRAHTFFPFPRLKDFAAFYAGAWAIRLGISPYELPPEVVETLRTEFGLFTSPPITYNPPIWSWLLQPFTLLDFPAAAFAWVALHLVLIAWIAFVLARIAGFDGWRELGVSFLITLTFGPVVLDLTLGQTSILLLTAALIIGKTLRVQVRDGLAIPAALAGGLAVGAKLFPVIWLGALPLLNRWRLFVLSALAVLIALSAGFVVASTGNQDYWLRLLPQRIFSASSQVGLDDQSFVAWLDRLGRPHTYQVPGLSVARRVTVVWSPSSPLSSEFIRWGGYSFVALLGLVAIVVLLRVNPAEAEGAFYLWMLYTLFAFPHIERYNHVLLLPAMAWLWGQGKWGCDLAITAYFLAGLSRLNHLWAILLPAPWGPLASGFGLYAVLLLGGGMVALLWSSRLGSSVSAVEISGLYE